MARNELYQVSEPTVDSGGIKHYTVQKFDLDFNPGSKYDVSQQGDWLNCSCFASNKSTCRHRQMIGIFTAEEKLGPGNFFHFDKNKWVKP